MGFMIETPPGLKGSQEQQLLQVYSYLFRLSENLNVALNNLNKDNYSSAVQLGSTQQTSPTASSGDDKGIDLADSYNELRALINNTTTIVSNEITRLENGLAGKYVAASDWGTFQENFINTIQNEAGAVVESYGYDSKLEALDEKAAGFSEYRISTEGYIRRGFIEYDENNVPIIGIAIGQGLTSTAVTIDGEEYQRIDSTQSCAFYTAEKVSFRVNGVEVAYVSNKKLFISDVEIAGSVIIGGEWMISTNNGLKIQWIGEVQ